MSPRQGSVGVVLAGGRSARMGVDKALLRLDGETLVARAVRQLRAVAADVVVADRGRSLVAGTVSVDDVPVRGPAAGLLGAARGFPGRLLLALACDLPSVTGELLAHLADVAPHADLVVPAHGGMHIEPLCARWGPRALAALEGRAAAGRAALFPIAGLEKLAIYRIEGDELARFGPPEALFRNLNTVHDFDRFAVSGDPPRRLGSA